MYKRQVVTGSLYPQAVTDSEKTPELDTLVTREPVVTGSPYPLAVTTGESMVNPMIPIELTKIVNKSNNIQWPPDIKPDDDSGYSVDSGDIDDGDDSETVTSLNPSFTQSNPALTYYKHGRGSHNEHIIISVFILLGLYEIIDKLLTNYIDVCERLQDNAKIDLSSVNDSNILSELCNELNITIDNTISLPDSSNVLITKGSLTQLSQDS